MTLQEIFSYIDDLDLYFIAEKMASEEYMLPRWRLDDAKKLILKYKRFLKLLYLYKEETLVPTKEIREFWQNHILYSRHYHKTCEIIFGNYFHYEPLNKNKVESEMIMQYQKTKELFFKEYGETI